VVSTASFAAVAALTFCSFSLVGQVMVEKARRDGIRATTRARGAANQVAEARLEIQKLVSPAAVDEWATVNGFVPVDAAPMAKAVPQIGSLPR
jgi:hypothetical protein